MRAFLVCLVILFTGSVAWAQSATPEQKAQLAPTGALRAAIVTIPFLAKKDAAGTVTGVAPDLGAEMARVLAVPYQPTVYETPPAGMKAMREGAADVIFLAPTLERIGQVDFAPAFMEMELSLLVMAGSPIQTLADVDQPGRRIVVYERSANEEMVRQKLSKATRVLVPLSDYKKAFEMIRNGEADAFADLLYQTAANQADMPGTRIVPGAIGHNALAIGITKDKSAAAAYAKAFTETAIKSGLVTKSIEKAGVRGAAPPRM